MRQPLHVSSAMTTRIQPIKEKPEMKRLKVVALAIMAVLALGALSAASASAALPEFSPATNGGKSSNKNKTKFTELKGIAAVECTGSEGTDKITSGKGGTFEETYTGCTALLSGKCTGLGNATKGDITTSGSFDLRFLAGEVGKASAALAFLINPVHFECEKTVTLISVTGCVAGGVTPVNSKTKTFSVALKQKEGVETLKEVENEANTGSEKCVLKSVKNSEAEKEAGQEQTDEIAEENEGEIIT
jgi:hypothetical protein